VKLPSSNGKISCEVTIIRVCGYLSVLLLSMALQTNDLGPISKSHLFHTMQVNSKTFIVEILIKVESLVGFFYREKYGVFFHAA